MDPQIQSVLTSVGLAVSTAIASWAASHGIIASGDQGSLTNALVVVGGALAAAVFAWWKARQHTQAALIKVVNDSDNGVKVVPATAPVSAVAGPLK